MENIDFTVFTTVHSQMVSSQQVDVYIITYKQYMITGVAFMKYWELC